MNPNPNKITHLTPEQEAEIPAFRQRYFDIASGGGRIDREALEGALADAYALVGKPAPELLVFDSPVVCMTALRAFELNNANDIKRAQKNLLVSQRMHRFRHWFKSEFVNSLINVEPYVSFNEELIRRTGKNLEHSLSRQLIRQLDSQLCRQRRDQFWGQLEIQLTTGLEDQLCSQLWGEFYGRFWDQLEIQCATAIEGWLWNRLGDQLRRQLGYEVNNQLYEQAFFNCISTHHDLGVIAHARFAQYLGIKFDDYIINRLDIMERICTQCEWLWPYENVAVASELPIGFRWDAEQLLHCEDGPAAEYADGHGLYAWHGIAVPGEWIVGDKLTPQQALTWENLEQRRAACEILGWVNILEGLDAHIIDQHPNPEIGELIEVTLPDIGRERFLKVHCPTGRTFAIPVPPEMTSALAANAWTYGFDDPDDYQLEVRT